MVDYFNISTFDFNVEVGERTFLYEISDLEEPGRFFSKSPFQTPGARFRSLHTTNKQEFKKLRTKNALGQRAKLKYTLYGYCVHFICQTDLSTPGIFLCELV
jgi:hypothetical protein